MKHVLRPTTFKMAMTAIFVAIFASGAAASTYLKPGDDNMIISSRVIITGKVISTGTQYDPGTNHVFTYIKLSVGKVLKGNLTSQEIVLKEIGGEADSNGTFVCSTPSFSAGERVLLYLDTWPTDGSLRVHEQFLGKFSITRDPDTGKLMVTRGPAPEAPAAGQAGDGPSTDRMDLSAYLKMVRNRVSADMADSAQFEAQYYPNAPILAEPAGYDPSRQSTAKQVAPEFHLFSPPGRWAQVDQGTPVMCLVNPTNSPDPSGAVTDVNAAMAAWSNVAGCALRVVNGGTTTVCQRAPGQDNVDFNNCDGFFSPGVCAAIIGQGGFDYSTQSPQVVSGTSFFQITDGFAEINPSAACSFIGQVSNLQEVLTHEMGHSLGMGHSWQPSFGGSPTATESDATMFWSAHFDGRGASIRSDDMAGITFIYPGSTSTAPNYVGYVDSASCSAIAGWAADRNRLNQSINVEVYDGTTLIATVPANISRPDVATFLGDNGLHGFNIPTPASLKDGNTHSVHVKFETSASELINSPSSINCGGTPPNYIGYVDTSNCTSIIAWAADKNRLNVSLNVSIYDGATLLMTVLANVSRPDVGGFIGDNGVHGINMPTPASLLDGNVHTVHIKFESSAVDLTNSPFTIDCTSGAPNYIGYVDTANCTSIVGWAADKNHLNTSVNVGVYNGASLIAIIPATLLRTDVGGFIGDNGLHGFNYQIPAQLLTGSSNTIHLRFGTFVNELTGSPVSVSCTQETPTYAGYVDVANCSQIAGWAADRKRLNVPITVALYDGSTLLVTVSANLNRQDVGAFLKDNGLHGFSIPTPSSLHDGAQHTLHLKFEAGTTDLVNSPASVSCNVAAAVDQSFKFELSRIGVLRPTGPIAALAVRLNRRFE